jgi:hypothetical protein
MTGLDVSKCFITGAAAESFLGRSVGRLEELRMG